MVPDTSMDTGKKLELITRNSLEIVTTEELKGLLENNPNLGDEIGLGPTSAGSPIVGAHGCA